MIKKIKALIHENRKNQLKIIELNQELNWANVYHDSIRGKEWLEKLPLNIGRWAGNYTFFYILNRILNDVKPKLILEFGLGESSKFIATYIKYDLIDTHHIIIEHDVNWMKKFEILFQLPNNSQIRICPLVQKEISGYYVNCYEGLKEKVNWLSDFYLIDGPIGSANYSRYDIVSIIEQFPREHQFVLLLDDYNRKGEQQTGNVIIQILKKKGIVFTSTTYSGIKTILLITTEKFKYLSSL